MALAAMFCAVNAIAAAPSYQAAGTERAGTGALTGGSSVPWPAHQTGDIGLLICETANQAVTLSTPAGFAAVTNSPQGVGTAGGAAATRLSVFWARATSASMGNVGVADSGNHQICQILTFRNVIGSGNPWDVTAGDTLTPANTAFTIPGAVTTLANTLVVAIVANATDTNSTQSSGWTNANLTGLTEQIDAQDNAGNGGGFGVATGVWASTGNYGNTTGTLANSSVQGRMSIALKPMTTTLGGGTNPSNVTLAPGASITDLDAFTFVTDGTADSITALTVTLTGTNSYESLSEVRITDSTGATTYFSAVANPASNTINFSGGTPIAVTTTATTFKIRITPKTHVNMPVPPGASYSVGGTITAFTSTGEQAGSDSSSAAVTVDNLSPSGATSASGTAGNGNATLNWTSSASGDLAATAGSIVYRWAAASAGSEVPAEGSTPTVGSTNGTATVACVVDSAASTALTRIDGTFGSTDCTSTALTNGQVYTYRIFQKDSNGNYDVGVAAGSHTPGVQNCTSQATGSWGTASTWTNCSGGIPQAGDSATIAAGHNVTLNVNTPALASLTINNTGTLTNTGSNTITLSGAFANSGTYSGGTGAISLSGNFTNTGSFSSGSGTWTFGGGSLQTLTGTTTFANLTFNNAAGLTLNNNVSVSGTLGLTNGIVSTGSNILTTTANCPASISFTSGWVAGNLRLTFPSGTTTCNYYVGSGTTYAPIALTLTTTATGTLTGSTTGNEQPQIATSAIDPTQDVNRYWTLGATGDTQLGSGIVSSYAATFSFASADVDIGATPTSFVIGKYEGAAWTYPPVGSAAATSTGFNAIAGPISGAADFAVGEVAPVCEPTSDLATAYPTVTFTCECDNFGRSALNPSTIFGGNWALSTSGGSFGLPQIAETGYLRLTDASTGVATAATVPGTFPAAGNIVVVEFKHYAYGGTTGADGIAVTLSDSGITPVPGAFGGSLGYAQKSNPGSDCTTPGGCPGFAGGWIGLAIDEYGNYSANTEGRTGGSPPGFTPDSVAVRGSGSGQIGYPYMAGTGTLTPGIDSAGSGQPRAFGHAYRVTVDARSYTWNGSSGTKNTQVSIYRDTSGAGSFGAPNINFEAYATNPSQADTPDNWKLSFTGSTGAATNIHEIAGLKICAQAITPPAGFDIQADNLTPSTCTTDPAGKPIITVRVLDSNGNVSTTYTQTVTLAATLGAGGTGGGAAATWAVVPGEADGTLGATVSGSASYTFAATDLGVAKFYLTDSTAQSVYITVTETGVISSSMAAPVVYSGTAFSVSNTDTLAANPGGGVVAGRAHLMSVTRLSACGTDTAFIGAKDLDGWYTPVDSDHPTGALAPRICAPNGGGTCQPATGACSSSLLSINAPSLSASVNNLTPLTFTSGVANFCLITTDVGKYSISIRDDSNVSSPVSGSSADLTARPFALVVNNVKSQDGSIANPSGTATGGSKFVAAGDSFQATVGAYLWNSAADTNVSGGDGSPDVGATLAQITANGLAPSYSWTTLLSAGSPFTPAGGALGSLSPTSLSGICPAGTPNCFTSGAATPTGLAYGDVGSFTFSASATSFLNTTSVDLSAIVFDGGGNRNAVIGRFYPDHFTLASSVLTAGCAATSHTYMGQPFGLAYTIEARNKNDILTQNYDNDTKGYSVAGTVSMAAEDGAAAHQGSDLGSRLSGLGSPTWTSGQFVMSSAAAVFSRPATPLPTPLVPDGGGPFDALALGVKVSDGDTNNPDIASPDMNAAQSGDCTVAANCDAKQIGSTKMRYGRLRLMNAYGSNLLNLLVPVRAEYVSTFNGTTPIYSPNTLDNCTTVAAAAVANGNASGLTWSGSVIQAGATLSGGSGTITVNKPSSGIAGTLDLALNLTATANDASCVTPALPASSGANLTWLQYPWCSGKTDPNARVKFGASKAPYIYLRERY